MPFGHIQGQAWTHPSRAFRANPGDNFEREDFGLSGYLDGHCGSATGSPFGGKFRPIGGSGAHSGTNVVQSWV